MLGIMDARKSVDQVSYEKRTIKKLSHKDFYDLVMSLDAEKDLSFTDCRSKGAILKQEYWAINLPSEDNTTYTNCLELDLYDRAEGFIRYYTNRYDDQRNERTNGYRIDTLIKLSGFSGMTLEKMYGTTPQEYCVYIPKQFYYLDINGYDALEKPLLCPKASYVDFCSHYPSNAMGNLPDANRRKVVEGYAEPTEEYPFAFYPDNCTCAEYGRFDMNDWLGTKWEPYLFTDAAKSYLYNKIRTTILMPASPYHLDAGWEYCYAHRKDNPNYKLLMNSTIGKFHQKGDNYNKHQLAHLAAVIIARANDKMIKLLDAIERDGSKVLHAVVDGVIYTGAEEWGIPAKRLGALHQEVVGSVFKIKGMNQYIYYNKDTKTYEGKHGAFNVRDDGKDINQIESFEDMEHWARRDYLKEVLEMEVRRCHVTQQDLTSMLDVNLKGKKEQQ